VRNVKHRYYQFSYLFHHHSNQASFYFHGPFTPNTHIWESSFFYETANNPLTPFTLVNPKTKTKGYYHLTTLFAPLVPPSKKLKPKPKPTLRNYIWESLLFYEPASNPLAQFAPLNTKTRGNYHITA
jgi:hypothetical protein